MATIHDVAAKAGVSIKTVSRYLTGYSGISDKTVKTIKQAIEDLEYYPSAAARSLRGESSGLISVITDNLTTTPFSFDIIGGIQSVCEREGKLLLIGETGGKPENFTTLADRFRQQNVEAIIKAPFYHQAVKITKKFDQCPLVLVNCFDEEDRFPAIVPDDRQGAYDLTRHLIGLGHRDLAFITLPKNLVAQGLRLQGFEQAMREAGHPINPDWIITSIWDQSPEFGPWLQKALERLTDPPQKPTAILCANDLMAIQVLMRLQAMNIGVPGDISVVGYDDLELISESTFPPLTTAELPYFQMGVRAAELALEMAKNGTRPTARELIRGEVIVRNSDRKLRGNTFKKTGTRGRKLAGGGSLDH